LRNDSQHFARDLADSARCALVAISFACPFSPFGSAISWKEVSMKIRRSLYTLPAPGPTAVYPDHRRAALPEHRAHPGRAVTDELESEECAELWSAWIDIGGEG
jgi:hypothetical protein